jgi:hypothetical protein
MTPEVAIAERLLEIGALTALISTRVYQLRLPQSTALPAVRVQVVGETEDAHLRGTGALSRTRVQVDAYAYEASGGDPYAEATAVAEAIHGDGSGTGLAGWVGESGGSPAELAVLSIVRVDRFVDYEAAELRLVRVRQDYHVWWKRLG